MTNISLFGWLDNIPFWSNLPYPTKGAILRALKAGLSGLIGILLAAATDGTLLPKDSAPYVVLIVTAVLTGLDKLVRETAIANDAKNANAGVPTSDPVTIPTDPPVVNTDATTVTPTADGNVVSTDATTVDGVPTDPNAAPAQDVVAPDSVHPTVFDDPVPDKL